MVGGGLFVAGGFGGPAVGKGQDLGFEIEADSGGVGGSLCCGRMFAVAVEVGVEGGEAEELVRRDWGVGAWEVFVSGEGYGYGGEGEVVALVGEPGVQLIADKSGLELGEGGVAVPDGVSVVVGLAVGAAAGFGVEELIVPEDGVEVAGDAGVGFDGGDEVVEAGFESGESVFGAQAAGSAMALNVEVRSHGGVCGAVFGESLLEEVWAVGDEAVDMKAEDLLHAGRVVGGPGYDRQAQRVDFGDVDLWVGEEGDVFGRESRELRMMSHSVGLGRGHEVREGVRHGSLGGKQR